MTFNERVDLCSFSGGIVDKMGIYKKGELLFLKKIFCDIQNYTTEKFYKNFGFEEVITNRIFCYVDRDITLNSILKKDNKNFEIKKIVQYKDYMELYVNEQ